MVAPALARALRVAPGSMRGLVGARPRCSAVPTCPERSRLRARQHKEKRLRRRRERLEAAGGGLRVPPPPPKGWSPKPGVEYEHPLEPDGRKATGVELPPAYSPRYVEAAWYSWWDRRGVFTPPAAVPEGGERVLSMVLPPPNVTGSLHLGHALTVALQDTLVRWRRMQGWTVLWLPGTDHAGIATQAVVERWLWQQRGIRRQDLTRSQFLEEVWGWKERHGAEILGQLRALGASLDWSRCAFTMDPGFSRAVSAAFSRLHSAGLIRRDRRLVSWSCALRSALADVEVEPRPLPGPTALRVPGCPQPVTFGLLVTFAYPVEGGDGLELPVATTRPETMLGDVAVAVHPRDPRYLHLHGRRVRHPFTGQLLPIVCDPSVEPDRGTGAVKVTPGHSPPDLALARAHGLPLRSVIRDDGTMCPPGGGWLQGTHRFQARSAVVGALAQLGLYRGTQDHPMTLPLCSRSGDVVEQLLKSQWFLRCREMAQRAKEAVTSQRLELLPKYHEKTWNSWMDNVGDWCLSRQLWWGHRVPAYRVGGSGCPPDPPPDGFWVVGRDEEEARGAAARALQRPPQELQLQQDPDVLDTWFSSALFPFASLGWPDETPDFRRFYPTSVLETGSDLLFFWVARMVMLGQELTGTLPFKRVLLHSLVRDPQGRKMSKSLGNVIDPCDIIRGATPQELQQKLQRRVLDPRELQAAAQSQKLLFPQGIPECGADALRMALCAHNAQGEEVRLDVGGVLSWRRFGNKVWNAVRFVLAAARQAGSGHGDPLEAAAGRGLSRWLRSRLALAASEVCAGLGALEPHAALAALQHFWLRSFCDVYLETAKASLRVPGEAGETLGTLVGCADLGLRLLGPFAPFLAEELWQRLPRHPPAPPTLCLAPFPDPQRLAHWRCPRLEAEVEAALGLARAARGLRDRLRLGPARPPAVVRCPAEARDWLEDLIPALQALARVGPVRLLPAEEGAGPGEEGAWPEEEGAGPEPGPRWVGAPAGPDTHIYLCLRGLPQAQLRARSLDPPREGGGAGPRPPPRRRSSPT